MYLLKLNGIKSTIRLRYFLPSVDANGVYVEMAGRGSPKILAGEFE